MPTRIPRSSDERGFTLIELMVVLLIIAILLAIAIPTFFGARERTQDRAAQSMLVTAAKAQAAFEASKMGYTDDVALLSREESSIDWTGSTPRSIHVVLSPDATTVLLYTRSNTGTWWGLALDTGVRGSCSGPDESDVNTFADCDTREW